MSRERDELTQQIQRECHQQVNWVLEQNPKGGPTVQDATNVFIFGKLAELQLQTTQQNHGYWQLCPKCDGQKKVLYPPYLPAGVESFSSSQTEWPCGICNGEGILARPVINNENKQVCNG